MLALGQMRGNREERTPEQTFSVVAVIFFTEREVARYPTREQAEWRARELNDWAERNPRGYVQYYVRPSREPRGRR